MKIVIEIPDESLKNAVEGQVGRVVAQYTESIIKEKVDSIVNLKMARLGASDIDLAMRVAAKQVIEGYLGGSGTFSQNSRVKEFLTEAALNAIKGIK